MDQGDKREIYKIIQALMSPLRAQGGSIEGLLSNHAVGQSSTGAVAVTTGATTLVALIVPNKTQTGKLRLTANITFVNTAAATHSLTPSLQLQIGTVLSTLWITPTAPTVALASGAGDTSVGVIFDIPATIAATFAGTTATVAVVLQAAADAATAIQVVGSGATLAVQELF